MSLSAFASLEQGEKVVGIEHITDDNAVDFRILYVNSPKLAEGSRVFLAIKTETTKNVLIGGNLLNIDVVRGMGWLTIINLKDGTSTDTMLSRGMIVDIPSDNYAYWYENTSESDDLVLRDTCPNFSTAHEPKIEDVVMVMSSLMLGANVSESA